eukprot:TRINITY_DN483_c0_g1_i3.p1 TRINITY_DN483_c0_g1~~TRINITY_DN483_c0_g1_i3.p1  ORF type:complete len:143 (+),score=19.45 TRINITY_DN483_c0_g1_i3:107-535(+)
MSSSSTTAASPSPIAAELLDADAKNAKRIKCRLCNCLILREHIGVLQDREIFLHHSRQPRVVEEPAPAATAPAGETVRNFWVVDDMFRFENIGFTKPIDDPASPHTTTYKYLTCADCEKEVLGIQIGGEAHLYLSCERVDYV